MARNRTVSGLFLLLKSSVRGTIKEKALGGIDMLISGCQEGKATPRLVEVLCPVCGEILSRGEKEYRCKNRHSFDIARQGHVNLLVVQQKHSLNPGDTRE